MKEWVFDLLKDSSKMLPILQKKIQVKWIKSNPKNVAMFVPKKWISVTHTQKQNSLQTFTHFFSFSFSCSWNSKKKLMPKSNWNQSSCKTLWSFINHINVCDLMKPIIKSFIQSNLIYLYILYLLLFQNEDEEEEEKSYIKTDSYKIHLSWTMYIYWKKKKQKNCALNKWMDRLLIEKKVQFDESASVLIVENAMPFVLLKSMKPKAVKWIRVWEYL